MLLESPRQCSSKCHYRDFAMRQKAFHVNFAWKLLALFAGGPAMCVAIQTVVFLSSSNVFVARKCFFQSSFIINEPGLTRSQMETASLSAPSGTVAWECRPCRAPVPMKPAKSLITLIYPYNPYFLLIHFRRAPSQPVTTHCNLL